MISLRCKFLCCIPHNLIIHAFAEEPAYEAHGYAGRESIGHVLYEMIGWFEKYVKNAPAREDTSTAKIQ